MTPYWSNYPVSSNPPGVEDNLGSNNSSGQISLRGNDQRRASSHPPPTSATTATSVTRSNPPLGHQCVNFAFPPPPPVQSKRIGPRRKFKFFFPLSNSIINESHAPKCV